MNLIQLSEQLKDVPDSFLQNEVTNPTGAYPAYLVVSELTRRKRMRDNVAKQEPSTTVAEDVMGLNAIPQAMQSLAAQDVAMAGPPQQMPRQPQRMPMPPRPQPQPQQMADGGLVAFREGGMSEGREPFEAPRSRFDILVDEYIPESLQKLPSVLGNLPSLLSEEYEQFTSSDPREIEASKERQRNIRKEILGEPNIYSLDPEKAPQIIRESDVLDTQFIENPELRGQIKEGVSTQDPKIRDAILRSIEGYRVDNVPVQPDGTIAERDRVMSPMEKSSNIISRQSGKLTGTENLDIDKPNPKQKEVGNAPDEDNPDLTKMGQASKLKLENLKSSFKTDLNNINKINKDISELLSKGKAPDELYQEGVDKYKREIKNPLRFLKDEIEKEEKRIEKLKFDNLNDALIQAGAAILQSPGGQNLQWLGKGLEGFQKAYKEGRKDIVDAKKDLLQSRIAFAESENDYARGAEEAGLRSLQRGETFQRMGLQKLGTEKALFAENINTALSIAQAESDIGLNSAKAYYYRNPQLRTSGIEGELTAKQQEMVYNEVRRDMADYANRMNITPSDPRYAAEENRLLDEKTQRIMLRNRGIYGAGLNEPRVIDVSSAFESELAPQ
jgi:hypothetical protein